MNIRVEQKPAREIFSTSVLQQSALWSEVKKRHGVASRAFDIETTKSDLYISSREEKKIIDDLLLLFLPVGNGRTIGYVPFGPTLKPDIENRGPFLEELSESLRPYLPEGCILLRFDLVWESPWADDDSCFDASGNWQGPPSKKSREIRLNIDTVNWNLHKADTDLLPPDTIHIDLRKDDQRLLAEMKPKTRYNVGLSLRRGVRVRSAGLDDLEIWYSLYAETCARNSIYCEEKSYFGAVLEAGIGRKTPSASTELLIAENDAGPLAAMFLVVSNRRATYLYGASASDGRNHMATYAIQWDAMRRARGKGCVEYDLFGIAPNPNPTHPLHGLYRFKSGFGGWMLHRMGCWDYPLKPDEYEAYRSIEMSGSGYHLR